jgi:hypothetical protein
MVNQELDYKVPSRPLVCGWLLLSFLMISIGIWSYSLIVMLAFACVVLIWVSFYSTALHYALDAEEFTKLPIVGEAFVTFQSHHFPQWINTIHRKPVVDLLGELNPIVVISLLAPVLIFRLRYREVFVAWGTFMLVGSYAMICHRWAHQPPTVKPKLASCCSAPTLLLVLPNTGDIMPKQLLPREVLSRTLICLSVGVIRSSIVFSRYCRVRGFGSCSLLLALSHKYPLSRCSCIGSGSS